MDDVVAPVLVHKRRARLARLERFDGRGQLLVVEADPLDQVLGFAALRRDGDRHRLADNLTLPAASTG